MSDNETNARLQELQSRVAELHRTFEERLQTDRVREKAFEQLYEELRRYKEDFLQKAERPLLLDLLLFYDSLQWFQESLIKQEMSPDVLADSFQYLLDEFLEVLYRRDVQPVETASRFDRTVQKAVKVDYTRDPEQDYRVVTVLKRGFRRHDALLRPEEVVIHRYRGQGSE